MPTSKDLCVWSGYPRSINAQETAKPTGKARISGLMFSCDAVAIKIGIKTLATQSIPHNID